MLGRALRPLDAGDGTVDGRAVEEAIRTRQQLLRRQRWLVMALIAACGTLIAERADIAPRSSPQSVDGLLYSAMGHSSDVEGRKLLQQQQDCCACPPPPPGAPQAVPTSNAVPSSSNASGSSAAPLATNSSSATATPNPSPAVLEPSPSPSPASESGNASDVNGSATAPPTSPPSDSTDELDEGVLDGDDESFALSFPELFSYVWVIGGSLCVCCSVFLFIHKKYAVRAFRNYLTMLLLGRCLRS